MHWTNEKPTVPGFYWRTDDQGAQVVEVVLRLATLFVWEPRRDHGHALADYSTHHRWAGPLAPPGAPMAPSYPQADAINRAAEALEKIAERLDSWDSATGATKLDVRAKDG